MFALTRQEKILIVCVMLSLVLGATVKHWRELRRETGRASVKDVQMQPAGGR
jgi:hypothetical protein